MELEILGIRIAEYRTKPDIKFKLVHSLPFHQIVRTATRIECLDESPRSSLSSNGKSCPSKGSGIASKLSKHVLSVSP